MTQGVQGGARSRLRPHQGQVQARASGRGPARWAAPRAPICIVDRGSPPPTRCRHNSAPLRDCRHNARCSCRYLPPAARSTTGGSQHVAMRHVRSFPLDSRQDGMLSWRRRRARPPTSNGVPEPTCGPVLPTPDDQAQPRAGLHSCPCHVAVEHPAKPPAWLGSAPGAGGRFLAALRRGLMRYALICTVLEQVALDRAHKNHAAAEMLDECMQQCSRGVGIKVQAKHGKVARHAMRNEQASDCARKLRRRARSSMPHSQVRS